MSGPVAGAAESEIRCPADPRRDSARKVNWAANEHPGVVAMSVVMTAMFSALSIVWDREFGFLREMLVAPVGRGPWCSARRSEARPSPPPRRTIMLDCDARARRRCTAGNFGTIMGRRLSLEPGSGETMTVQTSEDGHSAHAIPHLSVEERVKLGKDARALAPRSSHAEFRPAFNRPDPVSLLERQATTRVPELVPIRYGRMLVSPFTFFRGAALIMASDLAATPQSGLRVQVCGDAHLSNFGLFASPERAMMFDVNDFDETLPGPWEWDLKRLAASVVIAARDREFAAKEARTAALEVGVSYRQEMARLAGLSTMDVWYSHIDVAAQLAELKATATKTGSKADKRMAERTAQIISKARTRDSLQALAKLATVIDGQIRIASDPPLLVPTEELFSQEVSDALRDTFHQLVRGYRRSLQTDRRHLLEQFQFVQIARKVVGVGSVGTRAWILLMVGRDNDDPLFLQAKEAEASVLEEFVGRSRYANHGARVVAGQHLMQAASDIFLGYQKVEGVDGVTRDFYIRQLRDWKGSFDVEGSIPPGLTKYVGVCAQALARAHARSGDRIAIATYLGNGPTFDRALAEFAETYADQNERDYEALREAEAAGRITVESGL
jgi:uncharacterized protein (DUF2252 family)